MIRFVALNYLKEDTFKKEELVLRTQLANKYSETYFKKSDFESRLEVTRILESNPKIREETHIHKYGGEEYLNISLEEKADEEKKEKKEIKEKLNWSQLSYLNEDSNSGYCRILIPPLIQYPHIRHSIKAQLIRVKNKTEITGEFLAELVLQIYYRLDFHGSIDIIPMNANLTHNAAQVG